MASIQPLFLLLSVDLRKFSKEELIFLEAELFSRLCDEIEVIIMEKNRIYFEIIKLQKENEMIENKLIHFIIHDILSTQEYTLSGIAFYTNAPEDVIHDLASGRNPNPTFLLSRKIIELHRTVRQNLYQEIAKKIGPHSG